MLYDVFVSHVVNLRFKMEILTFASDVWRLDLAI